MKIFCDSRQAFRSLCIVLMLIVSSQSALAQQENNGEVQAETAEPDITEERSAVEMMALKPAVTLEQITVTGQRSNYLLRAQIEDAKQSLYSTYNDMNQDDDFDVNCRQSDWTGTHIRELICWPVFFERAVAENSQDFLRGNAVLEPVGQLRTQYQGRFEELQANIIKVAAENPEVEDALIELGTLEAAYERKMAECKEQAPVLFIFRLCR